MHWKTPAENVEKLQPWSHPHILFPWYIMLSWKNCLYSYKYLYPYGNPYGDHSQILISIGFESINKPKVNTYLSVLMYLRYWRQNKNKYKARFYTLRIYTTIGIAGLISNRGVTEPVANILLSWSQAACEKAQLFSAVLGAQTRRQYGWWKK